MTWKTVLALVLICLAFGLVFGLGTDEAHASTARQDREIATREGVGDSLATKTFDGDKLPGRLEIGIAIGSTIVMVAVWKYL